MMTKTRAFVLRTIKYGDASLIVDLFTEEHGRMSFVVRVSKARTAKFKPRMFQPMTFLDVESDIRQNNRLQTLRNARISYPYSTLTFDAFKLSITLFVADFLTHSLRGEQANENLVAARVGKSGAYSAGHSGVGAVGVGDSLLCAVINLCAADGGGDGGRVALAVVNAGIVA